MSPKTVLITGCSSGIGLATAVLLANQPEQEFKVYATMRNLGSADDLKIAAAETLNKTLFIRELDVTKEATISKVVDEIIRDNGRIDVLINNAGYSGVDAIDHRSLDWCHAMMDTNYWGVVRMIRAALPTMKKQKSGRILNVTSVSGIIGTPFYATYASSKFAVEGFTESVAAILRKGYNIRISLIEPGPVRTPLMTNLVAFNRNAESTKDYDDALSDMFSTYSNKMMQVLGSVTQTAEEIAQINLDVIRSEKPHLRYQTSEAMKQMVAAKLKDTTTDFLLDAF